MKMNKFLFLLWFNSFFLTSIGYSIVFIHLGPSLPEYVNEAVFQARLFNKNCKIYLLANQKALDANNLDKNLLITLVPVETLQKTQFHEQFINASNLDRGFRDGFWFYTSERFFYLDDFMQQYKLEDVFHLENDTMLYVDIEQLLTIFIKHYPGIAIILDNDQRCIPCFCYIKNSTHTDLLAKCFLQNAYQGKNDMEILALFKQNNPEMVRNLPIIMNSYKKKYPLRSTSGHRTVDAGMYSKNINLFKSIFDGAALGQYLGGIDPRNGLSQPGFINESCLFNPANLKYKWIQDNAGRKVPFAIFNKKIYRINNLHIHSKNLKQFLSV